MQRLFWPESLGRAHGYLLHPPGGLAPGDRLEIDIELAASARVLLTTPSAGRVYRTDDLEHPQGQTVRLTLAENAELEWLPQETILFSGVRSEQQLALHAHPQARFFLWDQQVLGRRGSDAPFVSGMTTQSLSVYCQQQLLWRERLGIRAGDRIMQAPWGLAGHHCFGVWVAGFWPGGQGEPALAALRDDLARSTAFPGLDYSLTRCDSLLVGRARAHASEVLRRFMQACWSRLRPALLGCNPVPPRIWDT